MSETPPTSPTEEGRRPRRLLRSNSDKVLGGVAGGLAEYFNVDPVLIRIGFVITGLMGIGLLAYLALFIFIPEDDGWGNPVQARDRDRLIAGGAILLLLIAIPGGLFPLASFEWWWGVSAVIFWLAVLAGVGYAIYWMLAGNRRDRSVQQDAATTETYVRPPDSSSATSSGTTSGSSGGGNGVSGASASGASGGRSFGQVLLMILLFSALAIFSCFLAATSAWGAAVGGGGFIAVVVILSGALIATAAFLRPMRWLIVPALALALPAAAVQASGYELEGGYGDRVIRPARLADIPEEGYKMAAGNLTIDLRQADWRPGSKVELPAELSFGRISVVVPEHVCVASDIEVWAGGFEVLGDTDSDYRVKYRRTLPPTATPTLHFDGQVDIGWVEVVNHMNYGDWHDRRGGLRDPDATQPAHCFDENGAATKATKNGKNSQSNKVAKNGPKASNGADGRSANDGRPAMQQARAER